MSKNISIDAHVKRYQQTELSDIVKLIDALTALVDSRRQETIAAKEKELELLKSGGIPEITKVERPKTTRGSKKNKTEQEAEG